MNKEIEIKIKLTDVQLDALTAWLKEHAHYAGEKKIVDYYVDNPNDSFYTQAPQGFTDALQFLRVRVVDEQQFFKTRKQRTVDAQGNTVDVQEDEFPLADYREELERLKQQGFTDQIVIRKTRDVFLTNGTLEIAIDRFEDNVLPTVVELEHRKERRDVAKGMKDIYAFLRRVGITSFTQFDRGVICMFLNPDYNFEKEVVL